MVQEVKACDNSGLYCNLQFSDISCNKDAPSNIANDTTIYGSCSPMNGAYRQCTQTIDTSNMVQEVKTCPSKQYCNLKYTDTNCTIAGSSAQGLLYGICAEMNSGQAVCPMPTP